MKRVTMRSFLAQNPNATTDEVIAATGAKRASVRVYRSVVKKAGAPIVMEKIGRPKTRMQSANKPVSDPVNHPAHYKVGGIETIDFIEAKKLNYNLGNVVKYITRSEHKGSHTQDLQKALWYLKRELNIVE